MTHTIPMRGRGRTLRALGAMALASVSALWVGHGAFAAAPPANASISNQATASYKDANGSQQLTTSNTVTTTVIQVGAYSLTPAAGNTKNAGAGAVVYMPYVLTNDGNGTDDFTVTAVQSASKFDKIEVYLDSGAGLPANSTPLCGPNVATQCTTGNGYVKTLAAGESFKYVVAYTVPSTAVAGTWGSSNTGTVTVTPKSGTAWVASYSAANLARTDTVNLVTGAAFSVTKAIMAPAVSPVSGTWAVPTSGPRGTTRTTYTITYSNNGAAAGHVYLKDELPAGLTYVANNTVASCNGGAALAETAGGNSGVCSGNVEFVHTSGANSIGGQGKLEAVIANVQPGFSGTLSFLVDIASSASVGTISNKANYTASGCSAGTTVAACNATSTVDTNSADFVVTPSRGLTFNTSDGGTPGTPAGSSDNKSTAKIVAGGFVKQSHVITNTGNAADTFNLSLPASATIQGGKSAFPAGTIFTWFQADGTTPLLDTNSDGIVDTGAIPADINNVNNIKTVVLQITIPSSTPVAVANYEAVALAQSINDSAIKDATYVDVVEVIGGLVDLTATAGATTAGDAGPGPGQTPASTTSPAVAGLAYHQIPLFVRNNDSGSVTYTLEASTNSTFPGSLPPGWSVKYSSAACSSLSVITTVTVGANAQEPIYACVSSPANEVTKVQPVYFRVSSSTPSTVSDILYTAVSVVSSSANSMTLSANGLGTVIKGSNVDFAHSVTNTGANTCANGANTNYLKVTADLTPAQVTAGWTVAIYSDADGNGQINAGDALITDGKLIIPGASQGSGNAFSLAAGKDAKFIVRVYAPGGANAGDSSTVTVTVTDVNSGGATQLSPSGCGTQSVIDVSSVVTGTVVVQKKQATTTGACAAFPGSFVATNQTAKPGDCLYYEVVATNSGSSDVSNVSITDAAPVYTTLQGSPAPTCTSVNFSGTAVTAATSGSTVSCGSSANVMKPGGTLTLRFAVQIQQ